MPYWFIVTRSFRITWQHRYLWLLAAFSGESGGGFNFSSGQRVPLGGTSRGQPNAITAQQQVTNWIVQHEALIAAAVILTVVLFIALFLLAAVCEGALVRASAEHDAEREFKLGWAWQAGRMTFWRIVRFRLLLFVLALVAVLIFIVLGAAFVFGLASHNVAIAVVAGLIGLLFLVAGIVYLIYLGFLDRLGTRALVLEQLGARDSIVRAHRLLAKRLGRVLLVWLLSIGVGIAVGIVAGLVIAIVAVPIVIAAIAIAAGGSSLWWIAVVIGVVIILPVGIVVGGFVNAQASTYWTLAFRRLDIDQA